MNDYYSNLGLDELWKQQEYYYRRNDLQSQKRLKAIDRELRNRKSDIDYYNEIQAEVRFGA